MRTDLKQYYNEVFDEVKRDADAYSHIYELAAIHAISCGTLLDNEWMESFIDFIIVCYLFNKTPIECAKDLERSASIAKARVESKVLES